jgi:4-hydroxybenzoate polyprenyltransferase
VQRGLVSLRELGWLFVILCALQLALALWLDPRLAILLAITWTYLALMSKEFFVADWLRSRPVLYMLSHMLIMPLVDLYATSADWLPAGAAPHGLIWFLCASYFNGLVIEIGRKIRSPADEEIGVNTYSALWGRPAAATAWCACLLLTAIMAGIVAWQLNALLPLAGIFAAGTVAGMLLCAWFIRNPHPRRGKWIERYAGIWTLLLYLTLGLLPHFLNRSVA